MSEILRYGTAFVVFAFAIIILNGIRKNKLDLKHSLIWLGILFVMLVGVLIPGMLEYFSKILGFEVTSNMIFLFAILGLLLISLSLTKIVSKQSNMIKLLTQEISMLKSDVKGENKR